MKFSGYLLVLYITIAGCGSDKTRTVFADSISKKATQVATDPDTLSYEIRGGEATQKHCPDSTKCAYAAIHYLRFKTLPHLNAFIFRQTLMNCAGDTLKPQDLDSNIKDYVRNWIAKAPDESVAAPEWVFNMRVTAQGKGLVVIQSYLEQGGGARPYITTDYLNWNITTDKRITLADIFLNGFKPGLTQIAEGIHNKEINASDCRVQHNEFYVPENFEISPKGIVFLYREDELCGAEILIPYSQIKHLLKPNTVVWQYIK